jgi:hypothetical protein
MTARQLDDRATMLAQQGADPLRLEMVRLARSFKRSWLEMAEALVRLRDSRAYEGWGYDDLYAYCADELFIKKRTVEKLTGSYVALERHAPAALHGHDHAQVQMPSWDALDYYARAVGEGESPGASPPPHASPDVLDELKQAVFDEGAPISTLRRRFHSVLYAKSADQQELEALESAVAAARRLASLLPAINGLSAARVSQVAEALEALQRDLDELLPEARDRVEPPRKAS